MNKLTFLFLLLPLCSVADVVVPNDKVQNSVNIRLEPDASSDVVGELQRGEVLPLVGTVEGWHEVQLEGGATGYVSAAWSRIEADDPGELEASAGETVPEVIAESAEAVVAEAIDVVVEEVIEKTIEKTVEESEEIVVESVDDIVDNPPEEAEAVVEEEITIEPTPEPERPVADHRPAIEIKADRDYVVKLRKPGVLDNSQIFDDGNKVGIGTHEPEQRLDVNGSIQIHDRNSNVAGLMITQASGETGYIMHNRASTLTIGAGSIDRITVDRDGNVGIGVARPDQPLQMASGAHVTAGGVWTNRSSRASKENIVPLSRTVAANAVMQLEPVAFNYRVEPGEDYVGFIAEDVPAILATAAGDSLSAMDIVAALTRVVQDQQQRIEDLEARIAGMSQAAVSP